MLDKLALFVFIIAATATETGYAIFEASAKVGLRSGKFHAAGGDQADVSTTDVMVSVHIDPIPFVPVSFGASASIQDYDVSTNKHSASTFQGTIIIPEIKAWLPMVPVVTPYAKVGYGFGAYKTTMEVQLPTTPVEVDAAYESTGPQFGVGLEYGVLPMLGVVFEINMSQQTLKPKSTDYVNPVTAEAGDLKDDLGLEDETFNTTAFLLGVSMGL